MIGDTEMSVLIYDACTLRRMEMLRARGLCGIRRCEDKGSVVREALRARVLIGRCEDKGSVVREALRARVLLG